MKPTMTIENRHKNPRVLYVEPEGGDFWLLPGQTFELRAETPAKNERFELWDNGDSLQVFFGNSYISVFCDGRELQCGHQRPPTE